MDLKSLDLDVVKESMKHTGQVLKDELEKDVQKALERIEAAVQAARLLETFPTGELIQRAAVAEVFPVAFRSEAPGDPRYAKAMLQGTLEVRWELVFPDGRRTSGYEHASITQHRHSAPPVVKTEPAKYRLLVFLVEQK